MAREVVAMESKLLAVLTAGLTSVSVSELCGELGISRQTFYKYRRRWEVEGPAGLVERSRRPKRSPGLIGADLEDEIVRLRKELPLDNGAQTIAYHLARSGWAVPSVATIHRALRRRGLVVAQPQKRPRSAWRRFEWPRPNAAWQIDATCWALSSGKEVWIMDLLDDHSRVVLAANVCSGPTSAAVWDAFCAATARWGLPAHVLSDNGTCFTHRFRSSDSEAEFEGDLRALGIRHILSSPAHPQTCGKLERFHQTLKNWLRLQPLARTHTQLQRQLDTFSDFYNHQRPHRSLRGATPAERWAATSPAQPGDPLPDSPRGSLHTVRAGYIDWCHYQLGIGSHLNGQQLLVIARGHDVAIFGTPGLVRRLTIDPTRRYQPTGKPPGRPPKQRTGPRH
jgi:transposase InsO family protein